MQVEDAKEQRVRAYCVQDSRLGDGQHLIQSASKETQLSKLMEGEGGLAHPAPVSMVIRPGAWSRWGLLGIYTGLELSLSLSWGLGQ